MASFSTSLPFDVENFEVRFGEVVIANSVQIRIEIESSDGVSFANYFGQFNYNSFGALTSGTINSHELVDLDNGADFSLSGLSLDAVEWFNSLESPFLTRQQIIDQWFTGDDILSGSSGRDVLTSHIGDDEINGGSGNDRLAGEEGDDILDGGAGVDTAVFTGNQSDYILSLSRDMLSVTDKREGRDGNDILVDIEILDFGTELPVFGDGPMNLDTFDDAATLSPLAFASIVELYIAYFNRAPDAIGLNFWASSFARNEIDIAQMAELFFDQAETRAIYSASLSEDGSQITDVTAFVTAIYTNVLGRSPDADGRDFWVNALEQGAVTPGSAIRSIIDGAKSDAPSDATQADIDARALDQQYLADATDIGIHFAIINGMSDISNADAVMDLLTRSSESVSVAVALSNQFLAEAQSATGGEFLMPLIGVLDDPFA